MFHLIYFKNGISQLLIIKKYGPKEELLEDMTAKELKDTRASYFSKLFYFILN
jgi:hypothetical protein